MVQVEADMTMSLLRMTFSRHVGPNEMERERGKVKALLADLPPGFRLLNDLSGLESMDPGCLPYISTNMDLCNQRGVSIVVRVIPDPHKDIGLNILSLFHYDRDVPISTCRTKEEAMTLLAG